MALPKINEARHQPESSKPLGHGNLDRSGEAAGAVPGHSFQGERFRSQAFGNPRDRLTFVGNRDAARPARQQDVPKPRLKESNTPHQCV